MWVAFTLKVSCEILNSRYQVKVVPLNTFQGCATPGACKRSEKKCYKSEQKTVKSLPYDRKSDKNKERTSGVFSSYLSSQSK